MLKLTRLITRSDDGYFQEAPQSWLIRNNVLAASLLAASCPDHCRAVEVTGIMPPLDFRVAVETT